MHQVHWCKIACIITKFIDYKHAKMHELQPYRLRCIALCILACILSHQLCCGFIPSRRIPCRHSFTTRPLAMGRAFDRAKELYSERGDLPMPGYESSPEEDAAMYASLSELLKSMPPPPKRGDKATGTVIMVDDDVAYVEIGAKSSAYLPLDEASLIPVRSLVDVLTVGQEVTGEVSVRLCAMLFHWHLTI